MGIGFDAAKQLFQAVQDDPTTARGELADAINALQAIIGAFDRANADAEAAYIKKVLASFAPERDATLKVAMASAWAAFEAAAKKD
jgi:hypothetical protein